VSLNSHGVQVDYDVVIVGGGHGGLYALYHLRGLGLRCRIYEAGGGVGGTWYWNRYPGARCDVESVEYCCGFSEELQQEWEWTERYAGQAEILRYLDHVADRFELRPDIQLNTQVRAAVFDEAAGHWVITTHTGEVVRARYCVMAIGFLSASHLPDIPQLRNFTGGLYHTGSWPHEGVDFAGRRVGIIGTGASGVQAIPRIAAEAEQLFVFQRSPNWVVPLQNCPMPPEYLRWVKEHYAEIRQREWALDIGGFTLCDFQMAEPNTKSAFEVSPEERREEYEFRWRAGGLHYYFSYVDLLFDEEANKTLGEFFETKIRAIVKNPDVADALVPRDHLILTKRLCGGTGYYEAFNRDNVTLVNIRETPIKEATPDGLHLANGDQYPLDIIVCATGWDAATGPYVRMDIRGREGRSLKDHWSRGCQTYLGLMSHGFPNMFILDGPQSPSAFYLPPLLIQHQAQWIGEVLEHLTAPAATIEPSAEAEAKWGAHVQDVANQTLMVRTNGPFMGANIPGKPREFLYYLGGFTEYRRHCQLAVDSGYAEFDIGPAKGRSTSAAEIVNAPA
jgi:cation diffusion facilitator CzcD-associated flavoprotein CzcO